MPFPQSDPHYWITLQYQVDRTNREASRYVTFSILLLLLDPTLFLITTFSTHSAYILP